METLAKFINDERTGLKYELCGDYYIIAGEDEPERKNPSVNGVSVICDTSKSIVNHFIIRCKTKINFMNI